MTLYCIQVLRRRMNKRVISSLSCVSRCTAYGDFADTRCKNGLSGVAVGDGKYSNSTDTACRVPTVSVTIFCHLFKPFASATVK